MIIAIVVLSIAIGTAADILYYLGLRKPGHTPPNRWSWLIFSFSAYIEVATFNGVSGDWIKVLPLATTPIACTAILVYVWRLKEDKWESRFDMAIDIFSVIASFLAVIIWLRFHEEFIAHIIMVIAVPVSYLPIWKDSFKVDSKPGEQVPWMLWTIMDAINLALNLHRLNDIAEIPYVAVELGCHLATWFLVSFRRSA